MNNLNNYLLKIENWLKQNSPEVYALLQPGLNSIAIGNKFNNFCRKLPREVTELYQWRNGCSQYRFFGFEFPPLEESLDTYEVYALEEECLGVEFFPIFQINKKTLYCTLLSSEEKDKSPLFTLDIEDIDEEDEYIIPRTSFANLTSMMQFIAECCEIGVFQVTTEGHIIKDDKTFETIGRKYNSN